MIRAVIVESGDTLSEIARRYLGTPSRWREIAEINKLPNPNLIYPGQVIRLENRVAASHPAIGRRRHR